MTHSENHHTPERAGQPSPDLSRRFPADDAGGTCGNIIDFASGPDEAPEPKMVSLPQWPGYIAHTRHGDWRIWLDSSEGYYPDTPVDMRCGQCIPSAEIGP